MHVQALYPTIRDGDLSISVPRGRSPHPLAVLGDMAKTCRVLSSRSRNVDRLERRAWSMIQGLKHATKGFHPSNPRSKHPLNRSTPFVSQIAPASSLLHLAADPSVMLRVPFQPDYSENVVYLGQFKDTKHRLVEVRAAVNNRQNYALDFFFS